MDIKKDFKNELLKRREVSFVVESDKNPSFVDMKKLASEEFKKPEENIDVYGIQGKFGRNTFLVKAYVYDSKEALEKAIQKTGKQIREEKKAVLEKRKVEMEAKKAAAEAKKAE
ncbi:hypothetical protein J4218_06065 [Candidatus Pacearchaeota archaeon]|nr:hypothetical protein [Candidatus Pacearchaeota archaeon]